MRAWKARPRRSCGTFRTQHRGATALLALGVTLWWSATASAQLDPLLFVKRVPPTVIVVVDTSLRMLEDGNGNFYDPTFYPTTADALVMGAFPSINTLTTKTYRRVYRNLQYAASPGKYAADSIAATAAVWDPANPATANSPADNAFLDPTRLSIARRGIVAAVSENAGSAYRWGLIKLRQSSPQWRVSPNCDRPVAVGGSQATFGDTTPCNAGGLGKYAIYTPTVAAASYSLSAAPAGTVMVTPAANTSAAMITVLNKTYSDNTGLVPAGIGAVGFEDRPLTYALTDARASAVSAMAADAAATRSCRNTVVVLVTGGKDQGDATYTSTHDPAVTANTFLSVTGGGVTKRVPIVVIAIKPAAGDEAQLQSIATNSGGFYRRVSSSSEVTAAVNAAVQFGFVRATEFNTGRTSEFLPVSPVVGTVELKDARDATGAALPNTDITAIPGGQDVPQRSNVMITAGFTLPGFTGALRAFRTYKPAADSTKPAGWKFVNDGTRLWPDLDGRPWLAGMARTPASPDSRNIYTFIPSGSGGSVVAFNAANAALIAPHLGSVSDPTALINAVRAQPLGAIIGSTPALMDPPSLDPPPDDDYGRTDNASSFAGQHKDRRALIFVGANDGMIHCIDARTGYEVWAFIPYNLLPKLRTLADGQPVEQFDYFVDSSPKLAEVKLGGQWRSMMIIGEGPGGTFYQAFDVTEAGMGMAPTDDGLSAVSALLAKYDTPSEANAAFEFKWAFPTYSSFDPSYSATFNVSDGTPGGKLKLYGDVKSTASYAEKTVGFTWSDPAVGALKADRSITAVIVGSGYFPDVEASIPGRGATAPKAGNAMYLLNAGTGALIGNSLGNTCTTISNGFGSGAGCVNVGEVANGRKNALQADPTAAGDSGSYVVNRAYLGDIDGRYWRFSLSASGTISAMTMIDTTMPIYASSALLFVGSVDVYAFFATGSDILPVNAPGGTGTFKLFGVKDNFPAAATTKFTRNLATVTSSGGIANGERPSTAPSVAGDIVFYTTTVEVASAPCGDFTSNLYAVTYAGGAAYDSDGNGKLDNNESPIATTLAGRATAPFIVDQHLYFGTTGLTGPNLQSFGDPEDFNNGMGQVGVRILSWREIR
jgi:PilC-like protein with beta-propeller domain